jgi:hypothetical protein
MLHKKIVSSFARSVDDLKDISNLGQYIVRAKAVLIFCSDGYFGSKNCIIELRASVKQGKLIIPVVDPDASKTRIHRRCTVGAPWNLVPRFHGSTRSWYRA